MPADENDIKVFLLNAGLQHLIRNMLLFIHLSILRRKILCEFQSFTPFGVDNEHAFLSIHLRVAVFT